VTLFLALSLSPGHSHSGGSPEKQELTRRRDSELNFFYDYAYIVHALQNTKKRISSTSLNKFDDSEARTVECALSLEFMNLLPNFHHAVIEYV